MSTIWVAAIIIAITVIPPFIFIRLHSRREKKRHETLLARFTHAGAKHRLSFTHQQMLTDKMLGWDANNRTLLLFAFDPAHTETVVRLTDVETCTVYNEYDHVNVGDKKDAKADLVLAQMGLEITFSTNASPLQIGFYNNHVNGIYDIPNLEKKVKEWESLLAHKASPKIKQRA